MSRILLLLCLFISSLVLSACLNTEAVPAWKLQAHTGLNNYKELSLKGKSDLAELSYKKTEVALREAGDIHGACSLILSGIALDIVLDRDSSIKENAYNKWRILSDSKKQDAFYQFLKTGKARQDLREDYATAMKYLENEDFIALVDYLKIIDPFSAILVIKLADKHFERNIVLLELMLDLSAEQGWRPILVNTLDILIHEAHSKADYKLEKSFQLRKEMILKGL